MPFFRSLHRGCSNAQRSSAIPLCAVGAVLLVMVMQLSCAGASGVEDKINSRMSYTLSQSPCVKLMTSVSGADIGCSSTVPARFVPRLTNVIVASALHSARCLSRCPAAGLCLLSNSRSHLWRRVFAAGADGTTGAIFYVQSNADLQYVSGGEPGRVDGEGIGGGGGAAAAKSRAGMTPPVTHWWSCGVQAAPDGEHVAEARRRAAYRHDNACKYGAASGLD